MPRYELISQGKNQSYQLLSLLCHFLTKFSILPGSVPYFRTHVIFHVKMAFCFACKWTFAGHTIFGRFPHLYVLLFSCVTFLNFIHFFVVAVHKHLAFCLFVSLSIWLVVLRLSNSSAMNKWPLVHRFQDFLAENVFLGMKLLSSGQCAFSQMFFPNVYTFRCGWAFPVHRALLTSVLHGLESAPPPLHFLKAYLDFVTFNTYSALFNCGQNTERN